ncbi:MAG: helix-turn-helix domain-containing protein, partial [Halanaerobiales bacterium]
MIKIKKSKTAEKTLLILEKFTYDKKEWGVTELSLEFGSSKSTIHRILKTLQDRGFLKQINNNGKYSLGYKLMELGEIAKSNIEVSQVAEENMNKLSDITNETILLHI